MPKALFLELYNIRREIVRRKLIYGKGRANRIESFSIAPDEKQSFKDILHQIINVKFLPCKIIILLLFC